MFLATFESENVGKHVIAIVYQENYESKHDTIYIYYEVWMISMQEICVTQNTKNEKYWKNKIFLKCDVLQ